MTEPQTSSPPWSPTTKLVVGLTLVVIVGALLVRFSNLIPPLLVAFMLSYVLHPIISLVHKRFEISWQAAAALVFLVVVVLIVWLSTLLSVAAIEQFQSLFRVVQNFVANLPALLGDLPSQTIMVGNFEYSLAELDMYLDQNFGLDFATLGEQALSTLQPLLGTTGSLLGNLATSAINILGRGILALLVSYFILQDAGQFPDFFKNIDLVEHDADLRRLSKEIGRIWNAFVRGQLLIFGMVVVSSFVLMSILGVRNALGIAFLAGLGRFVPYVGSFVTGTVTALVAFFQDGNYLGIEAGLNYMIVVVVAALILDQIFDGVVSPRVFGRVLGVHPAAVLVAALVAASLLGLIGLLLAAPVLASLQLFAVYAIRKMLDLNPWTPFEDRPEAVGNPLARPMQWVIDRIRTLRERSSQER